MNARLWKDLFEVVDDVVDGVSAVVPLAPADRQELLEADGPIERATRLIRFLAKAAVPL